MHFSTTILASILLASANSMVIPSDPKGKGDGYTPRFVPRDNDDAIPHKYIVVMKPGIPDQAIETHKMLITEKQNLVKGTHLKAFSRNSGIVDDFNIDGQVKGYTGYFAPEALEELKKLNDVALIEQDSTVKHFDITTQVDAPWGLARISTRESLNGAATGKYIYDSEGGSGVTAYVLDTGIHQYHKDLEDRVTWGANMVGTANVDHSGHGTVCASVIGGKTFGVAKKVDMVAVKVFEGSKHDSAFDIIKGLQWAAEDAESRKGKPGFKGATANLSLGGLKSEALNLAAEAAAKSLILNVAAGNENQDACSVSPASAEGVITVGATNSNDARALFSNYGKCVDIFAPGEKVEAASVISNTSSRLFSGTSVAAPYVTGLVAYFLSLQPDSGSDFAGSTITTAQMKKALVAFGTKGVITNEGEGSPNVLAFNGAGGDLSEFFAAL